jgi:hypothetical protein
VRQHKICSFSEGMHVTIGPERTGLGRPSRKTKPATVNSKYAIGEIKAYIAIRDELLTEAEQQKSSSKLEGLTIANDFVESCLQHARSPYQAQFLPEADAIHERKKCRAVRLRVADLREHIEHRSNRVRRSVD